VEIQTQNVIIARPDAKHGAQVGIVQAREVDDRGRVRREGAVLLVGHGNGKETRILLSPDEARDLGVLLVATSFQAAGVVAPEFKVVAPDTNGVAK
jgi:hypothetical protein